MSCAGPSGDRRVIPTIDLLLDPAPATHHRHCVGLPRRMDLLFELIGSPRRDCVREFYALGADGTRDFRQLFVRILAVRRVVHRAAPTGHRKRDLSTGLSTDEEPALWTSSRVRGWAGARRRPGRPPLRTPAAA